MRVTAEVPAWMIADGEYGGVAVGRQHEFGFALEPASIRARTRDRGLSQVDGSSATWASGVIVKDSSDVEGRLVVEPYLWVPDGMLWPTVPDGVRLWSVCGLSQLIDGAITSLDALPAVAAVDHDARYLVQLERP